MLWFGLPVDDGIIAGFEIVADDIRESYGFIYFDDINFIFTDGKGGSSPPPPVTSMTKREGRGLIRKNSFIFLYRYWWSIF